MPVDFSQLQSIQAPKAMGSVPMQQNSNPLTNLGTGLTNAVQAGQSAELNSQNIKMNDIKLQEAQDVQQKRRTEDQIVKDANGNWDNYIKLNMKVDPVGTMDAINKKSAVDLLVSQTRNQNADAGKKEMDNSDEYWAHLGGLASTASSLTNPDGTPATDATKNAFMQKGMKMFPKEMQDGLAQIAPEGFTQNNAAVLTTVGSLAAARIAAKNAGKVTPTDFDKTQNQRDTLQDKITKQTQNGGKANPQDIQDLSELNDKIKAGGRGNVQDPAQKVEQATTTESLKALDKSADTAIQDKQTYSMMKTISDQTDFGSAANVETTGRKLLQAISSSVGVDYDPKTASNEGFKHLSTVLRLNYISQLKGRPNMQEWNQVMDAVPQLTNTKDGRDLMISMGTYLDDMKVRYRDFSHDWQIAHGGSLVGRDNAWGNFVASNGSGYDKKTNTFDSSGISNSDYSQFVSDPAMAKPNAISPLQGQKAKEQQAAQQGTQQQQAPQGQQQAPQGQPPQGQPPITKSLNGNTYIQQNGKWYQQ